MMQQVKISTGKIWIIFVERQSIASIDAKKIQFES